MKVAVFSGEWVCGVLLGFLGKVGVLAWWIAGELW
jgi:hypothetical protein